MFAAIHHLKSSPTFSVRPCSSVGRVTVDLSGGRGFDSHRGQKIFSLPRVVPCFPLLGLTPSGLFMGLSSTLIYTSGLILCSTILIPLVSSFHFFAAECLPDLLYDLRFVNTSPFISAQARRLDLFNRVVPFTRLLQIVNIRLSPFPLGNCSDRYPSSHDACH